MILMKARVSCKRSVNSAAAWRWMILARAIRHLSILKHSPWILLKLMAAMCAAFTPIVTTGSLLHSLIELAKTFGIKIIAECIEEEAESEFFRKEGVNTCQGYYYGKPEIGIPQNKLRH